MPTQLQALTPSAAPGPVFSAITTSTRHIYLLLRCIGFMPTANVSISADNVRFSVEDSHSMQANVCLTPDLFSSYNYTPSAALHAAETGAPPSSAEQFNLEAEDDGVRFQISLSALLECLQIFGADASKDRQFGGSGGSGISGRDAAAMPFGRPATTSLFDANALRLPGTCRFVYQGPGYPLSIILEESGVTTTCHLTTFITPSTYDLIPFSRSSMTHKIILKAAWLHDALSELDSTTPETLTYTATTTSSSKKPHFSLSASGILSSATVELANNKNIMETFSVTSDSMHRYKFALIRKAMKAMSVASKVSLRGDEPGVLSMQYLIEMPDKSSAPTFIDFRFLPLTDEDGSDDDGDDGEETGGSGGSNEEGEDMML
ncbi:ssDNA endodeoxyribonuclease [Orbilia brochopaga]|uniref:SsDNA endodeoxyribonuclease n=1 Tax=Orbilia brochopaga TaxID=3140254 RepID=A0AAV9UDT6_9PEZI